MHRHRIIIAALLLLASGGGCRSTSQSSQSVVADTHSSAPSVVAVAKKKQPITSYDHDDPVKKAAYQDNPPPAEELASPQGALPAESDLGFKEYVDAVVARHPSIQAMAAAWQAAAQRYPQAIALDDPMFMAMTAPESINSAMVEGAYALELRQKLPWFGKRALRGEAASEEAAAASHEYDDARLKVALAAQLAYIDYYLADRQLELNAKSVDFMTQFKEIAQVRYQTNQVTQQDVLQAELELAELARKQLELQKMRKIAGARMNALLLRDPSLPLSKPQLSIDKPGPLEDSSLLQAWAIQHRPDLSALSHRVQVESANVALTYKQYYPDAEFFGRYDTFWQPSSTQGDLRGQVGVLLNLPVYRGKLNAAVCEAQARLQKQRAEYEQLSAEVRLEVQTAIEQLRESEQAVSLYEKQLMPAAEQYLEAARSNYEVGKSMALDLVQAQRQVLNARIKQVEASATMAQRLMELERTLGGSYPMQFSEAQESN